MTLKAKCLYGLMMNLIFMSKDYFSCGIANLELIVGRDFVDRNIEVMISFRDWFVEKFFGLFFSIFFFRIKMRMKFEIKFDGSAKETKVLTAGNFQVLSFVNFSLMIRVWKWCSLVFLREVDAVCLLQVLKNSSRLQI